MLNQYRALARKYRPTKLSELVGQEALQKVLRNSIEQGRVHHAYLFTGIRGVGKTTTARIIARSLNCLQGSTVEPCGTCDFCTGIAEDRLMDVIEIDAASRTGVGDIREIIENSRYLPVAAKYKIYIIDEVHMLSASAFNALLKTLEEPPPHVKFILATTEIRKIPLTIISRCQRFDLKRVPSEKMTEHLKNICTSEGASVEDAALAIIYRASEGSVRDALSMLDQAIAMSEGVVTENLVASMLGLGSGVRAYELFEKIAAGQTSNALKLADEMAAAGMEPATLLSELMNVAVSLSRCRAGGAACLPPMPEEERGIIESLAARLGVARLSDLWQAMVKSYQDLKFAHNPVQALQMAVIRLCYLAGLPSLDKLTISGASGAGSAAAPQSSPIIPQATPVSTPLAASPVISAPQPREVPSTPSTPASLEITRINSFAEMVAMFEQNREGLMASMLKNDVRPVSFQPGRLELNPCGKLPQDFSEKLAQKLRTWTAQPWEIALTSNPGGATIAEEHKRRQEDLKAEVMQDPNVKMVLEAFPTAQLKQVKMVH